jgi:glucose dehydrogenase
MPGTEVVKYRRKDVKLYNTGDYMQQQQQQQILHYSEALNCAHTLYLCVPCSSKNIRDN